MISTVGLHRRGNRPFSLVSDDYRVIPGDAMANDLVISHVSTNCDRTGFQQDLNVIFPIDRLREMVGALLIPATKPKSPGSDGDYAWLASLTIGIMESWNDGFKETSIQNAYDFIDFLVLMEYFSGKNQKFRDV